MERSAPVEGGGKRCDTLCCILNRSLELLCLLLILGTFFLPAFSVDVSAKNAPGTLGICDIENPTVGTTASGENTTSSAYNRVYFGYVPEKKDVTWKIKQFYNSGNTRIDPYDDNAYGKAIYWRVLNTTANDDAGTPALFMLTEYCISKMSWDNTPQNGTVGYGDYTNYRNKWIKDADNEDSLATTDSVIKMYLQGPSGGKYNGPNGCTDRVYESSVYEECFDEIEQDVMWETTKTETSDIKLYRSNSHVANACSLNNEKIFLLSTEEVINKDYGFAYNVTSSGDYVYPADTNRKTKLGGSGGSNANWWLRSTFSYYSDSVTFVNSSGDCSDNGSSNTGVCVRCALNIPLSSILFATNADSPTPSSTFTFVAPTSLSGTRSTNPDSGAGSKLTIVDDISPRRNFWVPQVKYLIPKGSTESGTTITLPYRRAKTGESEYISAIIKDKKDSHRYYARLKPLPNLGDSNGTVTMIIPGDIPFGDYTLIIMNEKENGYRRTNYAKNANLRLYIDGEKILITGNDAIGACTIRNPEYDPEGSTYDRVYFGRVPSSAGNIYYDNENCLNKPIYWRVLNTCANDIIGTPALFMLTEYTFAKDSQWGTFASNNNWKGNSIIRTLLNESIYNDCFDNNEKSIIMSTYNGETTTDQLHWRTIENINYYAYGCGLEGEKIFLLSAKEVTSNNYGFNNTVDVNFQRSGWDSQIFSTYPDDVNRINKHYSSDTSNNHWWLRSSCYDHMSIIDPSGCSGNYNADSLAAIRFALNLPLSQILFTQNATTQYSTSSTLTPIMSTHSPASLTRTVITNAVDENNPPTSGSKLTIVDNNRCNFAIEEDVISGNKGKSISIHYSGATVGTNEYISAIIKSTSGNPLYHARLKPVGTNSSDSSGTLTMYIPLDIDHGDYTMVVYNEKERNKWNTNYAGYDTLVLTVADLTSPTITNTYRNKLGNKFKLTAIDENLSHISTLEDQRIMNLSGTDATKNFQLGQSIPGIRIYDITGNTTTVYTNNIPIDYDPPNVTVSYANGTYTLTVSDNESGVWKITNSNDDTIYRDYSTSNDIIPT